MDLGRLSVLMLCMLFPPYRASDPLLPMIEKTPLVNLPFGLYVSALQFFLESGAQDPS